MICFCAAGCDRNSMADPGVFPPCKCSCHDREARPAMAVYRPGDPPRDER